MISRILLLGLAGFVLFFGTGCTGEDENVIVIGFAGPLSGGSSAQGQIIIKAIRMHVEEINARGGINGKKVKLIEMDDASNQTQAATVATKLAGNPAVVAVLGHFNSRCTNAGKNVYEQAKVPQFSYASTNPEICIGHPWTFRNIYKDIQQGIKLAQYAKKNLKLENVVVFFQKDDYGEGLKDAFMNEAKNLDLEVVHVEGYTDRIKNFKPIIDAIKSKNPKGIVISGLYKEGQAIAIAARDSGLSVPILGGDGVFSQKYIELAGPAAKNTYVTCPFVFGEKGGKADEFFQKFKKKFKQDPDCWSAQGYDAMGIIARTIETVGTDQKKELEEYDKDGDGKLSKDERTAMNRELRKKIRDYLAGMTTPEKAYNGITGLTYFDSEGDVAGKPIFVAVVKDGKFAPTD